MTDFIPQPTILRDRDGVAIRQVGDQITVNNAAATFHDAASLRSPQHYLSLTVSPILPQLISGAIAGVAVAHINGKNVNILMTAEQYALGAGERARYEAWKSAGVTDMRARQAAEREYDRINNEGGEGYNPHRTGDERTYDRNASLDRAYPEGA